MYLVKFREPKNTESSETWWPEGAKEGGECDEGDAWTRFALLLHIAFSGAQIEGAYVSHVRVEDARTGELMLSIDPIERILEGEWADRHDEIGKHFAWVHDDEHEHVHVLPPMTRSASASMMN